ncbi:MAG: hypothetical protein HYV07_09140 [Deltaproteobacteria bacterium]|nr:hypothetical protein [Deltaproteobacteria bacterium]
MVIRNSALQTHLSALATTPHQQLTRAAHQRTQALAGQLSEAEEHEILRAYAGLSLGPSLRREVSAWVRAERSARIEADGCKPPKSVARALPILHAALWPSVGAAVALTLSSVVPALIGVAVGLAGLASESVRMSARGTRGYGVEQH